MRRTACAHAQFSRCSLTTNAHSETWTNASLLSKPRCLSSHSVLSVLVGALFKKFDLYLNMPCIIVVLQNCPRYFISASQYFYHYKSHIFFYYYL